MSESKPPDQRPRVQNPVPKKLEDQLLKAGSRVFLTQFPNPERRGCPDARLLRDLAWRRRFPEISEVVGHLTECSPCCQEHRRYLRGYRTYKTGLRIAAVLLLALGATWLWLRFFTLPEKKQAPEIIKKAPIVAPQVPPQPEVREVALDLRNRSYTRGETPPQVETEKNALRLPRERLRLKVYLPLGSEAGKYEVQIRKGSESILKLTGTAHVQNGITVFTIEADLSSFVPGNYLLAIRPPESTVWRVYAVVVP